MLGDVIATLRVFWPHVTRGGFYFVGHDDHDVANPLESKSFQLKSRRKKTSSSSSSFSSARVFEDYERTLSQKTQKMMAKVNFYEDLEPILSVFACARVCVSHANRCDWATDILLTNFSRQRKEVYKIMLERMKEILYEYDEDDNDNEQEECADGMDAMELAMLRMGGKSSITQRKRKKNDATLQVNLRQRVRLMNEFDEYIARHRPKGYVDFICYCSFCGYSDGIEKAIAYRNRAKISSPLSQGWRWLERLDDIDRRFDFFNSEDEDEVISLFRIQIAKFIEAVAILNGVREELDEETIATYRRNIKKKKIDIRVNSLDLLLEHTTYNTLTDNARRWSTYLYAYATPTIAALKALKRVDEKPRTNQFEWLEVGAGKGVWARAMLRFGIHITATDSMPEDGNEYHLIDNEVDEGLGFSVSNTVKKMPHLDAIKKYKHANGLFMCYCPPDSDMGSTSLKAFRGEYVAIIGEDLMNTGDLEMFRVLDDQFKVTDRVYLPQWMDTVHHLTIFKRRSLGRKRKKSVVQIKRCHLCRCDQRLFSNVEEHEQEHYLRFLPPTEKCGNLYETVVL
tara:strand:+ start:89 stop:1792 length:1704 start_codon:yes stop_codon:yes gene_type:complete